MFAPRPAIAIAAAAALTLLAGPGAAHGAARAVANAHSAVLPAGGVRVPFTSVFGLVRVPVRINGSPEVQLVLDTGITEDEPDVLLHDRQIADAAGLKGGKPIDIGGPGAGPPLKGRVVQGVEISIGGLKLSGRSVTVTDNLPGPLSSMKGAIGRSIFERYAVDIDFEHSVLTIREPAGVNPAGMVSLPLTMQAGIPTIQAAIEDESGHAVPVCLVLDLGAAHTLSLHPNPEKGIREPSKTLSTVIGRGLQGEIRGSIGRIRGLRLGSLSLPSLVGDFDAPESGTTCAASGVKANGNLGIQILRRFHVILDYPGRRLLLAPIPGYDRPFEYTMSGLGLSPHSGGGLVVVSILPGSPGKKSGSRVATGSWPSMAIPWTRPTSPRTRCSSSAMGSRSI